MEGTGAGECPQVRVTIPNLSTNDSVIIHRPWFLDSHLMAMLLGASESIPIRDYRMKLGEYQSIILVELDGARDRTVAVSVIGVNIT